MPSFFPEGDAPLATDPSNKSLQKINSLLQAIETNTAGASGGGLTDAELRASPVPVDIGSATLSVTANGVEIKNDIGNPIPVSDAGGSLTVDGSVSISNSSIPVTDNGGSLTVDGTVELGATSLSALENIQVTFPSTQNVSVQNASLPVTGTFWQATQPISDAGGSLTVDGSVSISNASLPVTDNGGSLTVDGTVTANVAGTINGAIEVFDSTDNVSHKVAVQIYDELGIAIGSNGELPISGTVELGATSLSALENISVTFPSTQNVSVSNFPATQPVSGTVTATIASNGSTGSAVPATANFVGGTDGTNLRGLSVDSSGRPKVRMVDSAGDDLPIVESGIAGTPSNDVLSIQGVAGAIEVPVSVASLPLPSGAVSDATFTSSVGANYESSATSDTGTFSLISLFKRLLGKLPSLTASSRVPVDVLPSSVTLVNAGSNFSYTGSGNHGAFDCGGDADFVVYTVNGGGGGFTHNIELSTASNFSSTISTNGNFVVVYNEKYPSSNNDSVAYRLSNSTLQNGSLGTYVINLTQNLSKYRYVRVAVTGGGGGSWTGRFTSYRSALRDGGANNTLATPLHRVPIAGVVDINTCINSIPVTGSVTSTDRGANGVTTVTTFTNTITPGTVASNGNRKLLTIFNEGAGNLHVLYGAGTASTTNYSVRIASGAYLEIEKYTGQVGYIFASSGTARITEIT